MSKLQEMRSMEQKLADMQAELAKMGAQVAPTLELLEKVALACDQKGIDRRELALALCPELASGVPAGKAQDGVKRRRARVMKVYTNPHNGKIVETKGGNNKTLKAWKEQFGGDVVESWLAKDDSAAA